MLVSEDIMDEAARRLCLPPEVVRERNFYREGDVTHYGQPVKDAARIGTIWTQLLQSSAFEERRAAILIGPEFGTVSRPDLVAAAREAGDSGFDVLIACAFNYEAHTTGFTKLGRIPFSRPA